MILTGQQRKILREGILGAYPNPDDLKILLSEQMDVQLGAIALEEAYNNKVFSLIQDFEANGKIEQFIRVVVDDKPNSPHLDAIKNNFNSILEQDLSLLSPKNGSNMTAICQEKLEHVSAASNTSVITKANSSKVSETDQQLNSNCNNVFQYKVIIIKGNLDEVDEATIKAIVELLRQEGRDVSIGVKSIEQGSIKITIKGTEKGLERIQKLFDSGKLKNLSVFEVLEVRNLSKAEQEKIPAKSIEQEESSQYYDNSDNCYKEIDPLREKKKDIFWKKEKKNEKKWAATNIEEEELSQYLKKRENEENENKKRWAEIFRIAFADQENPERFREQFTKMIEVPFDRQADLAYEKELRKQRDYLVETQAQIYRKLEEYLEQQDWKKADYETAFIMYQLMVIENYDDFNDLFRKVSLDVINEIDRLWMQYSNQKFGIKGQAKIYRDLGGTEEDNNEVWERFGDRVGWREGGDWLSRELLSRHTTKTPFKNPFKKSPPKGHLPVQLYLRSGRIGWFSLRQYWLVSRCCKWLLSRVKL